MVVPVVWSRLNRTPWGREGSLVGVRVDPPRFGRSGNPIVDLKKCCGDNGRPNGGGAEDALEFVRLSTDIVGQARLGGMGWVGWDGIGWDGVGSTCEAAPKPWLRSFGDAG